MEKDLKSETTMFKFWPPGFLLVMSNFAENAAVINSIKPFSTFTNSEFPLMNSL